MSDIHNLTKSEAVGKLTAPCSSSPMGVFQRLLSINVNLEQASKTCIDKFRCSFCPLTKLTCLSGNKDIELKVKLIWVKIQGEALKN